MTSNHEIYEEDTLEKDIVKENLTNNKRVPKGPWGPQLGGQDFPGVQVLKGPWGPQYGDQDPSEVYEDTTVVPIIETDDYLEYQLPFGWKKVGKKRKNDGINRRWDFYIYTPWGEQLRSNPEISSYLDRHPDTKCDRKVTNTSRPLGFNSWETRLKTKQISTASAGRVGGAGCSIEVKTVPTPKLSELPPVLCSSSTAPPIIDRNVSKHFVIMNNAKKQSTQKEITKIKKVQIIEPSFGKPRIILAQNNEQTIKYKCGFCPESFEKMIDLSKHQAQFHKVISQNHTVSFD